jgi:hypothetical protein
MALFDKKTLDKTQDILQLINKRRRQILVHSAIYYEFNDNLISDKTFDDWCKELVNLHAKYPKQSAKCVFNEVFRNWTGFSGYDLLKGGAGGWATMKAQHLLAISRLL